MTRHTYRIERIKDSIVRRNEWVGVGRCVNFTEAEAILQLKKYGHRFGHHNVRMLREES